VTDEQRLRELFADETARRIAVVVEGCEAVAEDGVHAPELIDSMRREAHAIKGAAAVIGQSRLAELAGRIEDLLAARHDSGLLEPELAARIATAARTLDDAAAALQRAEGYEPQVSRALESLGD
jgi:chemotaxis protein histidine kinase CheA